MKTRALKVYEAAGRTDIPQIRLQGKWVEDAGFRIGSPIKVEVRKGRLTITLLPAESPPEPEKPKRQRPGR